MNPIRRGFRLLLSTKPGVQNYSSSSTTNLVDVNVNDKNGVATVTMQRQPVNGLNLDLLRALSETITDLEKNKSRGMILTSASNTVFSAGLDLMEMYKPDPKRSKDFWMTLQECWMKFFGSTFPTAAAINGHSPAGGCLLALCCEYRVMVNNFTIGLNETKLGIIAPSWFVASLKHTIDARQAEIALTTGYLFKTEEALKVGLIDEIANDKADAIVKCENFFKRFAKINPTSRAFTKQLLRKHIIDDLAEKREEDLQIFLAVINEPKVQKSLELYLEGLKKKSSA